MYKARLCKWNSYHHHLRSWSSHFHCHHCHCSSHFHTSVPTAAAPAKSILSAPHSVFCIHLASKHLTGFIHLHKKFYHPYRPYLVSWCWNCELMPLVLKLCYWETNYNCHCQPCRFYSSSFGSSEKDNGFEITGMCSAQYCILEMQRAMGMRAIEHTW